MKETGVVRKLDNLGRLVIPKEIRRCMRIKEGSPIEFGLLPSGEIVLCKYSLVSQISDHAEEFCEILGDIFNCVVMVGDRDKIIASYGISKKIMIGAKMSGEVLDIIDSNNSYMSSVLQETTVVPIIEDDKNTYKSELIYPIVIAGEKEGVIILSDIKGDIQFDKEHVIALKIISNFLSKQME